MQPEDRLDALLSARPGPAVPSRQSEAPDDALAPLLDAAGRLRPLREARPQRDFAAELEQRLLEHTAARRSNQKTAAAASVMDRSADGTSLVNTPISAAVRTIASGGRRAARFPHVRIWQAVAAAVLLLLCGAGLFSAAAMAAPGSPLYALRRWEQDMRASLDTSAADRVHLHIQYATDALAALQSAAAQHRGDPAYRDALNTVRGEDAAAASDLSGVPAGDEHEALQAQLAALRDQERQVFYDALPLIDWPDRLATTQALGVLGAPVPVVTSVRIERDGGPGGGWRVVVEGSGFAPDAVLVVGGQPLGQVVSVGPAQLIAAIGASDRHKINGLVGVQNPDGTCAAISGVQGEKGDGQIPGPDATPTHAGDHGDDHGSNRGGKSPTPTPGDAPSPSPSSTPHR